MHSNHVILEFNFIFSCWQIWICFLIAYFGCLFQCDSVVALLHFEHNSKSTLAQERYFAHVIFVRRQSVFINFEVFFQCELIFALTRGYGTACIFILCRWWSSCLEIDCWSIRFFVWEEFFNVNALGWVFILLWDVIKVIWIVINWTSFIDIEIVFFIWKCVWLWIWFFS